MVPRGEMMTHSCDKNVVRVLKTGENQVHFFGLNWEGTWTPVSCMLNEWFTFGPKECFWVKVSSKWFVFAKLRFSDQKNRQNCLIYWQKILAISTPDFYQLHLLISSGYPVAKNELWLSNWMTDVWQFGKGNPSLFILKVAKYFLYNHGNRLLTEVLPATLVLSLGILRNL